MELFSLLAPAFLIGLAGSTHCVGMCGPIALAMGQPGRGGLLAGRLLYHIGRAITYAFLGSIAGLMGQSFIWLTGYQLYLNLLLSVLLLGAGLFALNPDRMMAHLPGLAAWFGWVRNALASLLQKAGWETYLSLGLVNGFLPCGLVYMALAGALASGAAAEGALYMFTFGLGTLPLMLAVSVAGRWLTSSMRFGLRKLYPVLFILMGAFMLFRALSLEINFSKEQTGPVPEVICH